MDRLARAEGPRLGAQRAVQLWLGLGSGAASSSGIWKNISLGDGFNDGRISDVLIQQNHSGKAGCAGHPR